MNNKLLTGLMMALAVLALVAGCASTPSTTEATSGTAAKASDAQLRRDYSSAAPLWEQAAGEVASSLGPESAKANTYLLNSADAWKLAGQRERAVEVLGKVDVDRLSKVAVNRHSLLNAELALDEGDLDKAEFYLDAAAANLDVSLRPRFQLAKRQLDELKSDPSSRSIAAASSAVREMGPYNTAAAVRVLQLLESVPSGRLEALAQSQSELGRWAELSLSVRRTLLSRQDLLDAATNWETLHPGHLVDAAAYLELSWQYGQLFTHPSRIAVLLPGDGNLHAAGSAIRDGLMSAYVNEPGQSSLDFIYVDEDPVSALMAYSKAAELGYEWVIGPLRRQSVAMIAELDNPPVPVLLLNNPESEAETGQQGTPGVYSLALSQSEEARSVARKILARGHSRVIMLVSDNLWGDRTQDAFMEEFRAGEGQVVALGRFGSDAEEHAAMLATLLRIEDSRQRKSSLQAALRIPLEFEATRRDDFDAIFMAADPVLGRQLKPQLRFYDAGAKPMFAMSRIFSGQVNAAADQDLNDVIFAATEWVFETGDHAQVRSLDSVRGGAFGYLFELGSDAWNVLPWLDLMTRDPDLYFPGRVGALHLGAQGQLEREPAWASFRNGRPVRLMDKPDH